MHACMYAAAEFVGFRSLENREANESVSKSIGVIKKLGEAWWLL